MNAKNKARAWLGGALVVGLAATGMAAADGLGVRKGDDHITLNCRAAVVTIKQASEVRVFGPGNTTVDVDDAIGRTYVGFKAPAPYFQAEILRDGVLVLRQKVAC